MLSFSRFLYLKHVIHFYRENFLNIKWQFDNEKNLKINLFEMLNIPFYKIILLSLSLLITIDLSNSKSLESKFNVDPIDDIGKEIKHFEETIGRHVFNVDPIDEIGKEIKHVEETTGRHLFNVEVLDVFVEGRSVFWDMIFLKLINISKFIFKVMLKMQRIVVQLI